MRRLVGGRRLRGRLLCRSLLHVLWVLLGGLDRLLFSMLLCSRSLSSILLGSTLLSATLLDSGRLGLGLLLPVPGRGGLLCLLRYWSMFHVLIIHMHIPLYYTSSRTVYQPVLPIIF